jgi:hypothetical protein
VWWDRECENAKRIKLKAFREYRNNGKIENYDKFKKAELSFQGLCHCKKTESWRHFCSTLNFQTRLSDVQRMTKRFRNPRSSSTGVRSCDGWMPEFVSKITPPFVPRSLEMQDGSSERFEWLAKQITMKEIEAALNLCNNTASGEDGIRFGMLKELPLKGKILLLHIST